MLLYFHSDLHLFSHLNKTKQYKIATNEALYKKLYTPVFPTEQVASSRFMCRVRGRKSQRIVYRCTGLCTLYCYICSFVLVCTVLGAIQWAVRAGLLGSSVHIPLGAGSRLHLQTQLPLTGITHRPAFFKCSGCYSCTHCVLYGVGKSTS